MTLDPDVMAARLRSYAQAIADDQDVTLEAVLESMRTALADIHHVDGCRLCSHLHRRPRLDPQDVTNA